MKYHAHHLMLGCSATALFLAMGGAACAQQTATPGETVTVTATRLQNTGFDAPTPTTIVGAADIARSAQPNVFEALTQLPSLQGSSGVTYNTGTTTSGLNALSSFNLRGLGILRTLTLLDGQRVVAANPNGAVDISEMPQLLIQRVDVVTGGASASWGSDAVAGVVNFVTDKKYEGFKANFQMGQSTYGDDATATVQMAAGTSFLGGRGHIEAAAEYSNSAGVQPGQPVSNQIDETIEQPGGRSFFSQIATSNYPTPAATPCAVAGTNSCQPQFVYGDHAQTPQTAPYGMILSGPLQGTIFGANGQASAYDYAGDCAPQHNGSATGAGAVTNAVGSTCFGTAANPGDQSGSHRFSHTMIDPLTRGDVYVRASYDLAPGTDIYATVNLSNVRGQDIPAQSFNTPAGIAAKCDNPYIAGSGAFGIGLNYAQSVAACNTLYAGSAYNGVTAAQIAAGTPTGTGAPVQAFDISTSTANVPLYQIVNTQRDMRRYVVGGEGGFSLLGSDWAWDSYFEHGENDTSLRILNMPLKNRFNFALDAIVDPSTGAIECRNPAARANGCIPYDPFTTSTANPAAIAYIDNQQAGSRLGGPLMHQQMRQDAFSANLNAAPVEDWAGKISIAAGFDYREEAFAQQGDPYAGGITSSSPATAVQPCTDPSIDCAAGGIVGGVLHVNPGNWQNGNFTSGMGNYHVWETYIEAGVPLIDTPDLGKAALDIEGRFERYSTAGDISTWKVGLTWDTPLDGLRLRALQSRDVRAPNLAELFLPPQTLSGAITNDFQTPPGLNQQVGVTVTGNPLLLPEKGATTELGLVFQPGWLPGFQTSFDYYRIAIKGVIASGNLNPEDLCFQGFTIYCSQQFITTKNGQPQTTTPGNQGAKGDPNEIIEIVGVPFNTAGLFTDGFDLESQYDFDLDAWDVPGSFALRSLINHTMKFIADPNRPGQYAREQAGVLGGGFTSASYIQSTGNVLTWKITAGQSWLNDNWSFDLTERWLAGGVMLGKWTSYPNGTHYITCAPGSCPAPTLQAPTTNFQAVPSVLYLDVGGSYDWSQTTQFYFKIDNIANQTPPNTGSNEVNNTIYDVIGRMYRIGVRFNN
ncbi:MAG TPA: TonB-dependent receptor plug domain-containing protein [Rhizomicrobium sp.]|nr:TonB-dependent receptor plug domain-containing protein [Rhizomicrobium sp.]